MAVSPATKLFGWLHQVQRDPTVTSPAFELAFVISQHINRETGAAWPTQQTLAEAIGVTDRTVRTLIEALVAGGHLSVQHARGRHKPNIYRLEFKGQNEPHLSGAENRKVASAQDGGKAEAGFLCSRGKAEADFHHEGPKTGNLAQEDRKSGAQKQEASFLQNYTQEPLLPASQAATVTANDKLDPLDQADILDRTVVPVAAASSPDAELYRRGREILGKSAGGLIRNLVQAKEGSVPLARAVLETASTKHDPREYLGAIIRGRDSPEDLRARGEAW